MATVNGRRSHAGFVTLLAILSMLLLTACSGFGTVATSDPYEKLAQAKSLEAEGRIALARRLIEESAAIFEESGDLEGLAEAYRRTAFLIRIHGEDTILSSGAAAPTGLDTGRADSSTAYFERAAAIERQLGNHDRLSNLHYNIGINYALSDRAAEACAAFDRSLTAHLEGRARHPDREPVLPGGIASFEELIAKVKQEAGCP